jgi:hypothetical protein
MRVLYLILQGALLAVFAVVLAKVLRASRGLNPLLGWMIGLAYFLLLPLTILVLNGTFELPPKFDVGQAWGRVDFVTTRFLLPYLIVWASLIASCMYVYLFSPAVPQENREPPPGSASALERTIWITMAMSVVDWAFTIHLVGGLDVFLLSHWYHRNEELASRYGDSFILLEHISLVNQLIFTSAAALYASLGLRRHRTNWIFTCIIQMFFLFEIVISGNRIFFACYLLAFLASCWIFGRRKILLGMLAVSPMIILIFSLWATARHDLTAIPDLLGGALQEESDSRPMTSITNVTMDATEGMDTLLLLHIPNDFGNHIPYLYGLSYSRALTSPIPRFIYPHKPKNFTQLLADVYLPGAETSFNATAMGEMYANFGPLTLILFPLLSLSMAFLAVWADNQQTRHGLLLPLLFVLSVWATRSTLEDSFIILLLAYSLIFIFRLEKGLSCIALGNSAAEPS